MVKSPRYKKSLKFYLLTQSVNRRQNELDNIRCKKFFSKNEIDSSRGWKFWDPFHFVVFLRSFLIGEALLPLCAVKKTLNISTIFINYKQRVISVYINYGSRPSPRCAFMFHGCITSPDMKYLLWHVPVTLISQINRCNFLLLLWKIAGKCDQSAGYRRQPAAILNPVALASLYFAYMLYS